MTGKPRGRNEEYIEGWAVCRPKQNILYSMRGGNRRRYLWRGRDGRGTHCGGRKEPKGREVADSDNSDTLIVNYTVGAVFRGEETACMR